MTDKLKSFNTPEELKIWKEAHEQYKFDLRMQGEEICDYSNRFRKLLV